MSIAEISPDAVLREIRAGVDTRAKLAERFQTIPQSVFIADVLRVLVCRGLIVEHDSGVIHVNDLIETLPHDSKEER